MATPIILGAGVIVAAIAGRHIARNGLRFGKKAGEEFVKGGFKTKMDRREALDILGLKYGVYTGFLCPLRG
jgi:DnaJ homolog subfamily C member 19